MTDYTTVDKVKAYAGIKGKGDDALVKSLITAVSRAFDLATGYEFGVEVETSRTFFVYLGDVENGELILDKPFSTISSIVNGDGVTLATSDYLLEPRDAPYTTARMKPPPSAYWTDGSDFDGIVVTGTVGYPLTAHISQQMVLWTSFMYGQKDNPLIDITAIESGAVITTPGRPKSVSTLIESYKNRCPSD